MYLREYGEIYYKTIATNTSYKNQLEVNLLGTFSLTMYKP